MDSWFQVLIPVLTERGKNMITASLFRNGRNQAVRLPKELEFTGINKVEIRKQGNSIIITPVRKSWESFTDVDQADVDFLLERKDVFDEGRVEF